jgi:hypothetical protein
MSEQDQLLTELRELTAAMCAMTKAVHLLVETNAALIQAMADEVDGDESEIPSVYLDGSPCR